MANFIVLLGLIGLPTTSSQQGLTLTLSTILSLTRQRSLKYQLIVNCRSIAKWLFNLTLVAVSIYTAHLIPVANAQSTTHIQTVYQSIGEFGEVKYSQFPPQAGTVAVTLQLRADGQQNHSGQRAANYDYDTHSGTNARMPASTISNPKSARQPTKQYTEQSSRQRPTSASSSTVPASTASASTQTQARTPTKPASIIAEDPIHQQQCQTLQLNLENLNAGGQIYEVDAMGLRTYLTATDVELKRDNTKQLLAQYCRSS